MNDIILKEENGQVLASSLDVAERFGKRHDSVLRDIDNIIKTNQVLQSDFILHSYKNSRNKEYRCYLLLNIHILL